MTIAEFLLARIADDEAIAAHSDGGLMDDAHFSKARVLAECEAKRRIVARWQAYGRDNLGPYRSGYTAGMEDAILAHALSYADHPDFSEAWA